MIKNTMLIIRKTTPISEAEAKEIKREVLRGLKNPKNNLFNLDQACNLSNTDISKLHEGSIYDHIILYEIIENHNVTFAQYNSVLSNIDPEKTIIDLNQFRPEFRKDTIYFVLNYARESFYVGASYNEAWERSALERTKNKKDPFLCFIYAPGKNPRIDRYFQNGEIITNADIIANGIFYSKIQ